MKIKEIIWRKLPKDPQLLRGFDPDHTEIAEMPSSDESVDDAALNPGRRVLVDAAGVIWGIWTGGTNLDPILHGAGVAVAVFAGIRMQKDFPIWIASLKGNE